MPGRSLPQKLQASGAPAPQCIAVLVAPASRVRGTGTGPITPALCGPPSGADVKGAGLPALRSARLAATRRRPRTRRQTHRVDSCVRGADVVMSVISELLCTPNLAPLCLAALYVAVFGLFTYGPGYASARDEAIGRANGICQCCGRRKATQVHHRALRYPPDRRVTAADLIAVCARCHWRITFRRLLDRAGDPGVWVILATGLDARYPDAPCDEGCTGRCRCVARHHPRSRRATVSSSAKHGDPGRKLDLWSLVVRCHLILVVSCVGCDRFVRLDTLEPFRGGRWPGSIADLRRHLLCCRCRSRTQWVLLASWLPAGRGADARPPRFPVPGPRGRS